MLSPAVVASELSFENHISIIGTAVSSACSVTIESGSSQNGIVDFGIYDKSAQIGTVNEYFSLNIRESGSNSNGCSAFKAGNNLVTVSFGDSGNNQLDDEGVITHGAGDGVRIEIVATDKNEASSLKPITINNNHIQYKQAFALNGKFNYMATAKHLDSASVGDYYGSLSVVFTYK